MQGLNNPMKLELHDSSTTAGSTGEGMLIQTTSSNIGMYSQDAGTITSRGSPFVIAAVPLFSWLYLALSRNASNLWSGWFSLDRVQWNGLGTFSKTFTVAKVGFGADRAGTAISCDFVDVVL